MCVVRLLQYIYMRRCLIKWTKLSERFTKVLPDGRSSIIITRQRRCPPRPIRRYFFTKYSRRRSPGPFLYGQTRIVSLVSNSSGSLQPSPRVIVSSRSTVKHGAFFYLHGRGTDVRPTFVKDKSTVPANHCHTREGKSIFDGGPIDRQVGASRVCNSCGRSHDCVHATNFQKLVNPRARGKKRGGGGGERTKNNGEETSKKWCTAIFGRDGNFFEKGEKRWFETWSNWCKCCNNTSRLITLSQRSNLKSYDSHA